MLVLLLAHLCCAVVAVGGRDVTRDYFGDIFRMPGCTPKNATRCDRGGARPALEIPGRPCHCQCAPSHFTYREDRGQCIKDIKECYMSVFYRPYAVEAIPLVFLPTSGQLVHPDAHLSLAGRRRPIINELPRCKATVSQYMTADGWRTITRETGGPVFSLFQDGNKTFLQFLGSVHDRQTLQQHLVLVRMFCKVPEYAPFETCVAIRVGWAPGVEPLQSSEGTGSRANMMVVGLSLGVLGMVYVLAVLVYLKFRRRSIRKANRILKDHADSSCSEEGNGGLQGVDPSKRLELYHTHSLGQHKTTAFGEKLWKPLSLNEVFDGSWTERPTQLGCEFSVQEFQLRPEHFEPEVLASPPQPVMDYLHRLQDSMTYARHRLRMCYRYQPTLLGIPEDDYFYQENVTGEEAGSSKERRTTPDGVSSSSNASSVGKPKFVSIDGSIKSIPVIPPRKPRRKSKERFSDSSTSYSRSSTNESGTEEEKSEIKNAMDTLNDTLEAIEYDIFKQDLLVNRDSNDRTKATETSSIRSEKRYNPPNMPDEDMDGKEFDTSSCSSLSLVTVLGKDPRKHSNEKMLLNFNESFDYPNVSPNSSSFDTTTTYSSASDTLSIICTKENVENKDSKCSSNSELLISSPQHYERSSSNGIDENLLICENFKGLFSQGTSSSLNPDVRSETHTIADSDTETSGGTETEETEITESECVCSGEDAPASKSPSGESMTTVSTSMTSDSLELNTPTPEEEVKIPLALMELWLSRLINGASKRCKHGRKSKRKSSDRIKPVEEWEHVCHKKRDPCPVHDMNDETSLIDRLVQNGNKTMTESDVSSYFQSLKQDIIMEHINGWLTTGHNKKKSKPVGAPKSRERNRTKIVPLADTTSTCSIITDSGFHSSCSPFNLSKSFYQENPLEGSKKEFYLQKRTLANDSDAESRNSISDTVAEMLNLPESDNELVTVTTE